MRWFAFIVSFLALVPLSFAQSNAEEAYEQGRQLYWNGDSDDEVIQLLSQAISLNPEFADAYAYRGNMWRRMGDLEKAQEDLDQAFDIDPENVLAATFQARLYIDTDNMAVAETMLLELFARNIPLPSEAYFVYGRMFVSLDDIPNALHAYDQAIAFEEEFAGYYVERGITYGQIQSFQAGYDDLTRALEINPNESLTYTFVADLFNDAGDYAGAMSYLNQALSLDPDNALALQYRGIALSNLGDSENALADLDRAIELEPYDAYHFLNRGVTYFRLGQLELALADLSFSIELKPTEDGYFNRAVIYKELGDIDQAINDHTQALALDSGYPRNFLNRANLYRELGNFEAALADYNQALTLVPNWSWALNGRGITYSNLGQYQKAVDDYLLALESEPNNPTYYYDLGIDYYNLGELRLAADALSKSIELRPDDAETYFQLGTVYEVGGEVKLALEAYGKAKALGAQCSTSLCEEAEVAP